MKKMFISLLSFFVFLLSSCSLPNRLPANGIWYNEELDIAIEFKTEQGSNDTEIINVIWNSHKNILHTHIGYGEEIYFYTIDENGDEIYLLEGHFDYSDDQFIIVTSKLAEPFEISGTLNISNDKTFIFTKQSIPSTSD